MFSTYQNNSYASMVSTNIKEKVGLEFFERYDWNLSEVEAEFGYEFFSI